MSESIGDDRASSTVGDGNRPTENSDEQSYEDPNRSPNFRWEYWSTTAAAVILIGTYGTWLWLLAHNATRPESLDFMMIIGLLFALVWTFGRDTAAAVKDFRNGDE